MSSLSHPPPQPHAVRAPAVSNLAPHWLRLLAFYVGVPLLLAMPQGFGRAGPAEFSLGTSLEWWTLSWVLYWWLAALCTVVAQRALNPWHLPAWLPVTLGALVSSASARWWHPWAFELLLPIPDAAAQHAYLNLPRNILDPGYLARLLQSIVPGVTFWVLAKLALDRLITNRELAASAVVSDAVPVAHRAEAAPPVVAVTPTNTVPRFLARLVRLKGLQPNELLALEAEDHYVKVHSLRGTELVYYRFGDAIEELSGHPGMQVSRSFWVRSSAISDVRTERRAGRLILTNGLEVQVSQSNLGLVRKLRNEASLQQKE